MTPILIILAIVTAYAAVVATVLQFFAAAARHDSAEAEWLSGAGGGEWGSEFQHGQPTATKEHQHHV